MVSEESSVLNGSEIEMVKNYWNETNIKYLYWFYHSLVLSSWSFPLFFFYPILSLLHSISTIKTYLQMKTIVIISSNQQYYILKPLDFMIQSLMDQNFHNMGYQPSILAKFTHFLNIQSTLHYSNLSFFPKFVTF